MLKRGVGKVETNQQWTTHYSTTLLICSFLFSPTSAASARVSSAAPLPSPLWQRPRTMEGHAVVMPQAACVPATADAILHMLLPIHVVRCYSSPTAIAGRTVVAQSQPWGGVPSSLKMGSLISPLRPSRRRWPQEDSPPLIFGYFVLRGAWWNYGMILASMENSFISHHCRPSFRCSAAVPAHTSSVEQPYNRVPNLTPTYTFEPLRDSHSDDDDSEY
jgi:hypothetical protein